MKKRLLLTFILLIALTMSGCGVKVTEDSKTLAENKSSMEKDMLGDTSVTETGVTASTIFKNSETTAKKHYLENDFMRVWSSWDEDKGWLQENLDGTDKKSVVEAGLVSKDDDLDILWLTNDWVYYKDEDEENLYRISIDYTKTPIYDTAKEEMLFQASCSDLNDIYMMVTDDYVLYVAEQDGETFYFRYDFSTQKSTRVFSMYHHERIVFKEGALPLTTENHFYLQGPEAIYSVSFDEMKKEKIADMEDCIMTEYNGMLYFTSLGYCEFFQYDGEKVSCVIKDKTFSKAMDDLRLCDDNAYDIEYEFQEVYTYKDRLYAIVDIEWYSTETVIEGKHKGETIDNEHERTVLLSADYGDLTKWEPEQELLEFILKNSKLNVYCSIGDNLYKTDLSHTTDTYTDIISMYDGKILFDFYSKEENEYYLYDVATKQIKCVSYDDYRLEFGLY